MEKLENKLREYYIQGVGVEFDGFIDQNPNEEEWIYNKYEECMSNKMSDEEQKKRLIKLLECEGLD